MDSAGASNCELAGILHQWKVFQEPVSLPVCYLLLIEADDILSLSSSLLNFRLFFIPGFLFFLIALASHICTLNNILFVEVFLSDVR